MVLSTFRQLGRPGIGTNPAAESWLAGTVLHIRLVGSAAAGILAGCGPHPDPPQTGRQQHTQAFALANDGQVRYMGDHRGQFRQPLG